jgi:hypothetical protein
MSRRADINVCDVLPVHWSGAGTNYIIQKPDGTIYMVSIDGLSDVSFKKSLDGGLTWSQSTVVFAGTATNLAVWYDRWSELASDYIVCAYTESTGSDTLFRTINTGSGDALSTQTTIFAGTSRAAGGHLSITRALSGNVYCKSVIDAGAEGDFFRLTQANFPNGAWDNRAVDETIATLDQMILLPNLAPTSADNSDIMAIFQDASVTETSRKLYDDSGDAWAEASINAAITELSTATAFANFCAAPDLTNNQVVLLVWTQADLANADLLCYTITDSAITAKTDVVTNSTDDQGLCAISIDAVSGWWYAFYGGISTGGETWNTSMHIYMKVSKDAGTSWGPETLVDTGAAFTLRHLYSCPWLYVGPPLVAWVVDAQTDDLKISVDRTVPRAAYQIGV